MNFAEHLCLWYLRLNGYFTMPNFIVHGQPGARTDVDVLGIRHSYSKEEDFEDDKLKLEIPTGRIDVVFAEAKTGQCSLNGPWRTSDSGDALRYVLDRVGLFASDLDSVSNALYKDRKYIGDDLQVRIVCFGDRKNGSLHVKQILWGDVIQFVHGRFQKYQAIKADHQQWDDVGKFLWKQFLNSSPPTFEALLKAWPSKT